MLHDAVVSAAAGAEPCISYSMPAVKLHGVVVYYACWENHMALYPMPSAMKRFEKELDGYETSKSTIKFPHGRPLPVKLIRDIVRFRIDENMARASERKRRGG